MPSRASPASPSASAPAAMISAADRYGLGASPSAPVIRNASALRRSRDRRALPVDGPRLRRRRANEQMNGRAFERAGGAFDHLFGGSHRNRRRLCPADRRRLKPNHPLNQQATRPS